MENLFESLVALQDRLRQLRQFEQALDDSTLVTEYRRLREAGSKRQEAESKG
ncbi:MAG: hypothetical protein ISS49_00585 [Anaerolineae bacterium]|nr:hypothetical protein [Anaerolineae bacterium]